MPVETHNDRTTTITPTQAAYACRRSTIQADAYCTHLAAELDATRAELCFARVDIAGLRAQNLELRRIISSTSEAFR